MKITVFMGDRPKCQLCDNRACFLVENGVESGEDVLICEECNKDVQIVTEGDKAELTFYKMQG